MPKEVRKIKNVITAKKIVILLRLYTSAITASAVLYDSSANASYHIVKDAPLPSGSTIKVISGQKIVLNGDDEVRVYASAATADAIVSVLEDVA